MEVLQVDQAKSAAESRFSDPRNFCVYRHTGPNNKVYIGVTCQRPEHRWGSCGHGYRSNPHFYAAIQKYGWDGIEHEVLLAGLTQEEASELEIALIAAHDSTNPEKGYNHAIGGSVNCGFHLSETRKEEIRAFMTARDVGQETREKLRAANIGKRHTQASKDKMRAAKLGKKLSAETREKMKISNRGKRIRAVVCVETGVTYRSLWDAEMATGAHHENIAKVCRGKRQTAGGLRWRYV